MTIIYTLTIFVSAFLLFLIQPMISKLMLPQLGGSPAVWNTAMMFFQVLLLLGYLYTHISNKLLGVKKQSILHVVLLVLSLLWLPVALYTDIDYSSSEHPISWVVTSLFFSVGIPFFLLASNAPLIQLWMANTNHKDASNPYFLYSASNVGSLLALLAYPFVIEPTFTLSQQTNNWSYLFVVFVALVAGCAWLMRKNHKPAAQQSSTADISNADPTIRTKLYWVALAFAPSSLMLGVTTYITTDIASMPLFWVIPLALYLITFIFAFGKNNEKITRLALSSQNILIPLLAFVFISAAVVFHVQVLVHILIFFVTAMVCHGTLAENKPSTKYLTEYFVWISFGGMLGGVFNSLIAPHIFINPIEYVLVLIFALLLRPQSDQSRDTKSQKMDFIIPVIVAGLIYLMFLAFKMMNNNVGPFLANDTTFKGLMGNQPVFSYIQFINLVVFYLIALLIVDFTKHRPMRLALCIFILLAIGNPQIFNISKSHSLFAERNFFGVTTVAERQVGTHTVRYMTHGTTTHGIQSLSAEHRLKPVSYYAPLIKIIKYMHPDLSNYPYAVLGLGAGTLACVGKENQLVDFYEIDPAVIRMAEDTNFFTYLSDCPTQKTITLGDGRLQLLNARDQKYGLIVMDAFTSDAIPMHLLTVEALEIYKSKLAKNGVIAFNITNRYLDLSEVITAVAKNTNLHSTLIVNPLSQELVFPSTWLVLTEDSSYYKRAAKSIKRPLYIYNMDNLDISNIGLWTDNYSNILQTLN